MTSTQNCAECGTRAEPGLSFCDGCGAVLSWSERASNAPAADSASAEPGWDAFTRPGGTGLPRPQHSPPGEPGARDGSPHPIPDALLFQGPAFGTADGGRDAAVGYGQDMPAGPPPASSPPSASASSSSSSSDGDTLPNQRVSPEAQDPASGEGMTDRARRLLVPLDDPEPPAAAPSVAPVLPGRPVAQRPQTVRAPGEELGEDGGTPCPWCHTRNRTDRHFCARCAMPMTREEHAQGRQPWWRRLLGFRNRETPWAGDRPRVRRAFDRVLSWVGAAVVLTLVIVLAVNIPKGAQATRDHFSKRAPVAPDHVSASRFFPGHKPASAFDELNNTWWGPGVSESGQGQWIEATFDQPTRLLDLIITPGVSPRADQNSQAALPHRIEARITLASGRTTTRDIVLDQGAGGQRRAFRVGDVTKVRFTLETAYQPSTAKQVAIAEIEFFGPSNASGS